MATQNRAPSSSIFIGNVGFGATEDELKALFLQVGPLKSFRLVTDRETGKTKGFAFAEYFDVATAQSAQRNLQGNEFAGRPLRIDFADNERDHKANLHAQKAAQAAAKDPITASEHTVAAALGGPGGLGQQQISEALAKMTRPQIYEIMSQMKGLIQQNPGQARQILVQNPQLTKALFQAQILLGMVKIPADGGLQPADPNKPPDPQMGVAPQLQGPQQGPAQMAAMGPGGPGQFLPPQQAGMAPQGMQQGHPMQHMPVQPMASQPMQPLPGQMQGQQGPFIPPGQFHGQPQQGPFPQQPGPGFGQPGFQPVQGQPGMVHAPGGGFPLQGPPQNFQPQSGPRPQGMPGQMNAGQPGQMGFPGPQNQIPQPGGGPMPHDPRMMNQQPGFDPRQQPGPIDPRQQAGQPHPQQSPHPEFSSMDPRQQHVQQGSFDPRQQQQQQQKAIQDPRLQQQQQQQQKPANPAASQPQPGSQNLGPAEQQALLRQVMGLTAQQIEMLPEAQRQQVLELQRQLRSQANI